jgi:DNA-binding transcriptional LysR family regulator
MDKFQEMLTFSAVVDAGSFVGGANTLDMSKAAVSRYVGDLETRLGVRLLHRTTRKLSLTEEGEVFYARCKELLSNISDAELEITSRTAEAVGLLRVSAPVTFGILHLASLWGEFNAKHPKVSLDITLSDRVVDIIEDGFDIAIRIAQLPNSTLISKKLASTKMVLCASPQYIKRYGKLTHPADLTKHSILAYTYWSMRDEWTFEGPEGNVTVKTVPRLKTNNGDTNLAGALTHQGIVLQPTFLVGKYLKTGELIELIPEYKSTELGIYAIYPTRKLVSPKVRLLIDFLVQSFKKPNW